MLGLKHESQIERGEGKIRFSKNPNWTSWGIMDFWNLLKIAVTSVSDMFSLEWQRQRLLDHGDLQLLQLHGPRKT